MIVFIVVLSVLCLVLIAALTWYLCNFRPAEVDHTDLFTNFIEHDPSI